ncbi:NAD(P)H-dependent oxidoreductase [Bifidobacterium tibiigranuli]|jgi:putative NADPH-quinone reductase|uniref:NAD(P)H-dependent oxidoreductase n=1 Tax=Bifidobacterium tibiigranuli TaxID=2172043 RepID=UPI0026ED6405|nr:NAD(P)H-dependent oxidoreductase [Bifidobacterium tibiigranuli]MCI1650564.1 NAD(P)H-dependent oxidoreductase [Bifidobacterium tibiigranuli]MCI1674193.1 NAD(P)H-dependent oxidoreductase [Bifidobacterium tibiigranuli]MCI1712446.1 NAD(P)H-dependent oxidoreductase [Bifidobacterium tibiigranuli]MCI2186604.1 NAD(P)H-dependent oxidoreductase [Bifidobacterium tibiigranuli]MCI2204210.1 NAD(P)H-dependent oxidoreductase [Bifidobacterium tibiigranuli]
MAALVVVGHPDFGESVINRHWVEALRRHGELCDVHVLAEAYPDGQIDAECERRLVDSHDALILQFPLYWFNCPPLVKQWLDDVLTHGWAYGVGGNALRNKPVALAVSAGIAQPDYSAEGRYRYTLKELLAPFETTFDYCHADYRPFFALYGTSHAPSEEHIAQNAEAYVQFVRDMQSR